MNIISFKLAGVGGGGGGIGGVSWGMVDGGMIQKKIL